MVDPLGRAIAFAHELDCGLDEYNENVFSLEKLAATDVPCKIWHGTGDKNVPVEINAIPFVEIRLKNKLQIALEAA